MRTVPSGKAARKAPQGSLESQNRFRDTPPAEKKGVQSFPPSHHTCVGEPSAQYEWSTCKLPILLSFVSVIVFKDGLKSHVLSYLVTRQQFRSVLGVRKTVRFQHDILVKN